MESESYPTQEQLNKLRKIWKDPGPVPAYHLAQKNLLKKRWPLLWEWMHEQFGE